MRHITGFKRLMPVLLSILISGVFTSVKASPWVTAYVGGWWFNNDNNGVLPIRNINFKGMTICDHMGLLPLSTAPFIDTATVNGWVTNSMFLDNSLALTSAAHAAGVKCVFTIGAWNTESTFLTATDPTNLPAFVSSLVGFLKQRHYDGIDVDWEPLTASDSVQYKNFIMALRAALPSPYIIMVTCGWGSPYSLFASIQSYVDHIDIMTYDLSWNSPGYNTWYAGCVYSAGIVDPYDDKTPAVSCKYLVGLYEAAGVNPDKLAIGSEPGGMLWKGCTGPDQSISTVTSVTPDVSYNTIMSDYYKPGLYHWDSGAEAAYLSFDTTGTSNDWFLSYDDTTALKAKLAYINSSGIGGIIIYEIGMSYDKITGSNPFLQVTQEYLDGVPMTFPVDSLAPSVSITSPSNGSVISGQVVLSADASDGDGISGVQFKIDGKNYGSRLTSPPYSIMLNTDSLNNGPHTFSATARDVSENTASASVTATVSNALPGSIYIYKDSLAAPWFNVSYSATVDFKDTSRPHSGSRSIKVVSDNWGGLYLRDGPVGGSDYFDCSEYDSLTFWIYPDSGISFQVLLQNDSDQHFSSYSTGSLAAGEWKEISLPLAELDPSNYHAQYVGIMPSTASQETYYVDDIILKNSSNRAIPKPVLNIYGDSLDSPWINRSWSSTVNLHDTSLVYSGNSSVMVSAGGWGAFSVHYGPHGAAALSPASLDTVQFEVYPTSVGEVAVLLEQDSGATFKDAYVYVPLQTWSEVKVPINKMDPSNLTFNTIDIINPDSAAATFYLDAFKIDSASSSGGIQNIAPGTSDNGNSLPKHFALEQDYPNPFNPATEIEYAVPQKSHVELSVYDVLGRKVATLVSASENPGRYSVLFDGSRFASGVYFYRLVAGSHVITKKMILLK